MSYDSFGSRFKAFRKSLGWTATKCAQELKVSQAYISQIESNQREPSLSLLRSIKEKLNLDLNYLISGSIKENVVKEVFHGYEKRENDALNILNNIEKEISSIKNILRVR